MFQEAFARCRDAIFMTQLVRSAENDEMFHRGHPEKTSRTACARMYTFDTRAEPGDHLRLH